MALIQLDHISFSYPDGRHVLDNLSLRLCASERIGLIGANGSGKTTLFHVIMGLVSPASGSIELFGKRVSGEKDFQSIRHRIGLLFQDADDQLFCPTVLEDVAFGPLNAGKSAAEAKAVARQTLHSLGLEGFENRITHRLSGGEKKLVSLATVLAMQPEVLLLDEPTTGLDAETTDRIIAVLCRINMSYIFISHNMDFIHRTTDRIYAMEKGRILTEPSIAPHEHLHSHEWGRIEHTHGRVRDPESGKIQ